MSNRPPASSSAATTTGRAHRPLCFLGDELGWELGTPAMAGVGSASSLLLLACLVFLLPTLRKHLTLQEAPSVQHQPRAQALGPRWLMCPEALPCSASLPCVGPYGRLRC